jgi:hypothetical protein
MANKAIASLVIFLGFISLGFSQDIQSRQVYTTRLVEGGLQFEISGKTYGPYTSLEGTPWFSPDGKSWAMLLRKADGKSAVLVNGQEKASYKEYNSLMDISLNPDGSLWSIRADLPTDKQARTLRIVNGKAYGNYDQVEDIVWSPAGKGWYFKARASGSVFVVQDGKKYGPFQDVRDAIFDAAGTRMAMLEFKANASWVRVNDKEYGPFNAAEIVKTGNGAFLGYLVTLKSGNLELTIADKKYGPYTYVDWGRQYVSADGKDWLVMVFKGARRILLQNGKETELGRLSVYKLAKGWMYTYEKGNQQFIVWNGKQFGPFETGRNLTVTRDGSTWAISHKHYLNNTETSSVTVNGTEYRGTGFAYVARRTEEYFSWVSGGKDSDAIYQRFTTELSSTKLYAVTTSAEGVSVSADGKTWGPYAEIATNPWASPDGSHWGLLAKTDDRSFVALVDGKESSPNGPFDRCIDFSISNSGAGWSFTAVPDSKVAEAVVKVVNGKEYGPFAFADMSYFSGDGTGFYFWARAQGKNGGSLLTFDEKAYGPFTFDNDVRLFDLDAGIFALVVRSKDGVSLQVNNEFFGPYQNVEILQAGERSGDQNGRYFGFVAFLKDGRREIHVQGDKTYGPYKDVNIGAARISEDGKDWRFSVRKEGSDGDTLLQNGVEQETRGFDIRPWAGSYLMYLRQNEAEGFYWPDGSAGPYSSVRRSWVTQDKQVWAAEAYKGDGPGQTSLVVVNGKEYPGEQLRYVNGPAEEYFTWLSRDTDGTGSMNTLRIR